MKAITIDTAAPMADQLLTSTPISPHQLAKQRFNFVSRVFSGSHRNVQANLTRSVDQLECSKRAFSGAIQRNSNGYIAPSDIEVPILVPADFFCHALPLEQELSFLSLHKAPTTPNGLNNG